MPLAGRRSSILAVLVLTLSASFAHAEPFALLASAKGRVEVTPGSGGTAARASFGRALERGDKVTVGPGGAATIYFSDGNVIELGEKSSVTVGGRVANRSAAGPGALPGNVYAQVSKVVTGGSRETGLVAISQMRSAPETSALALAPRQSAVLGERPEFAWRAVPGATRYVVRVSGDGGALWSRETGGTSLPWPADADPLAADAEYEWTVEAHKGDETLRAETCAFRVMGAEASSALRADLARIDESAGGRERPAALYLSGSYLLARGVLHDAISRFQRLGALEPDAPAPHEALGRAYRAAGLMDQAANEFQRALELTKNSP